MWSRLRRTLIVVVGLVLCLATGCKRSGTAQAQESEGSEHGTEEHEHGHDHGSGDGSGAAHGSGHGSGAAHGSETGHASEGHEEHHHGGIHLADIMQTVALRFSAIWFAGKAKNKEMVDYQLVELREAYREVEKASPVVHGVDVAERLEDIINDIERLPKLVEKGKEKSFRNAYCGIVAKCSQCHADSGYDFIDVKIPYYNPYPNLKMK